MPSPIAFCRRALLHFERKRKLSNTIRHEVGEVTKIVGPVLLTATLNTGKDCWIGTDFKATANGVVGHKDFEPETPIGGVPAKTIKHYKDGERGE